MDTVDPHGDLLGDPLGDLPAGLPAGRLLLRPLVPGDATALAAVLDDPQVARWTPHRAGYAVEDAARRLATAAQARRAGERVEWAVVDTEAGDGSAVVGTVGLYRLTAAGAEVGWTTAAPARGRGVATAAVRALCRWAHDERGLRRLRAVVEVGNTASLRVAQRAGLRLEGTERGALPPVAGAPGDAWSLARLAGDAFDDTAPLPRLPALAAGDLVVRPWAAADAGAVEDALRRGGLVVPGLRTRAGEDPAATAAWWAARHAAEGWATGRGVPAGVWRGPELVGSLQLFRLGKRDGVAEVGVWTAPAARRQGVARTAVGALLDWAVPALALRRVEWVAQVGNDASVALAHALGFVPEGVARLALTDDAGRHVDGQVLARAR